MKKTIGIIGLAGILFVGGACPLDKGGTPDTTGLLLLLPFLQGRCRNFATSTTDQNATVVTCSFLNLKYTCGSATFTYASNYDFVEEAYHVGASYAATYETPSLTAFNYESGVTPKKLLSSANATSGYTATNTAWDASNRPTAGTFTVTAGGGCAGVPVGWTYADDTRTKTVLTQWTSGTGGACLAQDTTAVFTYDADMNVTSVTNDVPPINNTYTITSTETVCE